MKYSKIRQRVSALLLAIVPALGISSPYCPNVAGVWTDWYGYEWHLTQSPPGYGSVSGYVANIGCEYDSWPVSGTTVANNYIHLDVTNPTNGADECTTSFLYAGPTTTGGCDTGSGVWFNDFDNSGWYSWHKPCAVPSSEYSVDEGPSWYSGYEAYASSAFFVVVNPEASLLPLESHDFREQFGTSTDACYFGSGSPFLPYTGGALAGSGSFNEINQYEDDVGLSKEYIDAYRGIGHAACGVTTPQTMQVYCNQYGWISYQTNTLEMYVGLTTIDNTRDGVTSTVYY